MGRRKVFLLVTAMLVLSQIASGTNIHHRKPSKAYSEIIFSDDFKDWKKWTINDLSGSKTNWNNVKAINSESTVFPMLTKDVANAATDGCMLIKGGYDSKNVMVETQMISAAIDCRGKKRVHLSFQQTLSNEKTAIVYVSVDGKSFVAVYDPGIGINKETAHPAFTDIDISSIADGSPQLYLKFLFAGGENSFWLVDEITVYASKIDAQISVTGPPTSCDFLSTKENVQIEVFNNGDEILSDIPVSYSADGGITVKDTIRKQIHPGNSAQHTFSTTTDVSAPGLHLIRAGVFAKNDMRTLYDTVTYHLYNGPFPVKKQQAYYTGLEELDEPLGTSSVDGNGDGIKWEGSTRTNKGSLALSLPQNSSDWFFTHCLELEGGSTYLLTYYSSANAPNGSLKAMIGLSAKPAGMTELLSVSTLTSMYQKDSVHFTVPSNDRYYIGFHGKTDSITTINVDDIRVSLVSTAADVTAESSAYSVYPNPAHGNFKIYFGDLNPDNKFVTIRNVYGEMIYQCTLAESSVKGIQLDQPAGVYILEIKNTETLTTYKSKIIIQ